MNEHSLSGNGRQPVRVALLGCGTVGSEVARLLRDQADDLAARVGAPVELVGVAVRRPHRHPELGDLVTTDAPGLVARDDVDVVVEVIGGIEPARTLLLEAPKSGKAVVTAKNALLAEDGASLAEATRLGYAEADPSSDVDGYDAAYKAAILASLAFHTRVTAADVACEGIRGVTAADITAAAGLGFVIKLLAICERTPADGPTPESISARVHPAMIP